MRSGPTQGRLMTQYNYCVRRSFDFIFRTFELGVFAVKEEIAVGEGESRPLSRCLCVTLVTDRNSTVDLQCHWGSAARRPRSLAASWRVADYHCFDHLLFFLVRT